MNTAGPTAEFVLGFFAQRHPIPSTVRDEQLSCRYLDVGLVDSMGIVEMIMGFEAHFGIRFSAEHLQSPSFQTVGGLIDLIDALRGPVDGAVP